MLRDVRRQGQAQHVASEAHAEEGLHRGAAGPAPEHLRQPELKGKMPLKRQKMHENTQKIAEAPLKKASKEIKCRMIYDDFS